MWLPEIFIKELARDQKKKILILESLANAIQTSSHTVNLTYTVPKLQWKYDNPVF